MNKIQRKLKEKENCEKYHTPSCSEFTRRKVNAIFINPANNLPHEIKKLEICYELLSNGCKFVTETVRNKRNPNGKEKKVDIVDISTGKEIEIINKHETDFEIKEYRKQGVIPIIVNPMTCKNCGLKYPKRNKSNICQICKKENKNN